jgi:MSHA pilin protein MshC
MDTLPYLPSSGAIPRPRKDADARPEKAVVSSGATSQKGFSLIELVTVMIVVGIVAAFGMSRMFSSSPFEERGFYDNFVGAIRYAQRLAVASRCTVQVAVAGNGYRITTHSPATLAGSTLQVCDETTRLTYDVYNPATGTTPYTGQAPDGVAVSDATFTFNSRGRASSNVTINVGTRTIRVVAETGFVEG